MPSIQHSDETLGEDDLSEDLDRLAASLQAERNELMSQSAILLPEKKLALNLNLPITLTAAVSIILGVLG